MTDVPLIHTTKGNLPVSDLVYATGWEQGVDYVKLIETYTLNGEVVRQSAHVLALTGLFAEPSIANLN